MAEDILIIDDDLRLSAMVADYLGQAGYSVRKAATGGAGLAAIGDAAPDAVILDLMLPDMDGFEVCRRLRARSSVPVLMLTARGEETDRIVGLELGADDYLPKPFNPRELLARIRAILRRSGGARAAVGNAMRLGGLEIDPEARLVRVDGEERSLTSYQFDLLAALARNAGRVLSRDRLLDLVRGEEIAAYDRSIDVHVSRIRHAIEDDPARPRRLVTVRGAGYMLTRSEGGPP